MSGPAGAAPTALTVVLVLALAAVGFQLATTELLLPWVVAGSSMEPALANGDRIIVDLWTYQQRPPRPGEVVLFRGPGPSEPVLIKRCAAPPEPFRGARPAPGLWPGRAEVAGSFWAVGDNPEESLDSRTFGPIPERRLLGRVVWRYWPPERAGSIR